MNSIGKNIEDVIAALKKRHNMPDVGTKNMTREESDQKQVDSYNATEGHLAEIDGYNCTLCRNKGDIQYVKGRYIYRKPCSCMETRKAIANMNKSGLQNVIRDYAFERFEENEDWQKSLKEKAIRYTKDEINTWFFVGGNPGSGKTHICTAICREFLLKGQKVKYMLWKEESTLLKAVINSEVYGKKMERLKNVDILYIDDFLKPVKDKQGEILPPTSADSNLAFEILDYRKNKQLRTIISSERHIGELIEIDEATGSRIVEMTRRKYLTNIKRDKSRNYRLQFDFETI